MKQIIPTEGIVLKVVDYKEQAVIATILTKSGKKNYIIKGAKKLAGGTRLYAEPVTKVSFMATSTDGLDTFTEGMVLDSYIEVKQHIDKMICLYPILEKIIVFSDQVTNALTLYEFVNQILNLLKSNFDSKMVLALFEVKLTYLIGIAPELKHCLKCGNKIVDGFFSIYDGGVTCIKCNSLGPYDLNVDETKTLELLMFIKLNKIDEKFEKIVSKNIDKILNIMDLYYQKHLDFQSKAKEITKMIV